MDEAIKRTQKHLKEFVEKEINKIKYNTLKELIDKNTVLPEKEEVKTADDLRALGWTDWYHPNYWVHPDLTDSSGKIDYTYLGMSLEQAIIYENSGKRK